MARFTDSIRATLGSKDVTPTRKRKRRVRPSPTSPGLPGMAKHVPAVARAKERNRVATERSRPVPRAVSNPPRVPQAVKDSLRRANRGAATRQDIDKLKQFDRRSRRQQRLALDWWRKTEQLETGASVPRSRLSTLKLLTDRSFAERELARRHTPSFGPGDIRADKPLSTLERVAVGEKNARTMDAIKKDVRAARRRQLDPVGEFTHGVIRRPTSATDWALTALSAVPVGAGVGLAARLGARGVGRVPAVARGTSRLVRGQAGRHRLTMDLAKMSPKQRAWHEAYRREREAARIARTLAKPSRAARVGGTATALGVLAQTTPQGRRQRESLGRVLTAPVQIGRAGLEKPGKTSEASVRTAQAMFAGIPVGLVYAAKHPVKALEMMKEDIERRYGPLVKGDDEKFRRIVQSEGITPYLLDAMSFAPASQVAGAAARAGVLGPAFQRWMGRRPDLRLGAQITRRQRTSRGVLGRSGQHFIDFARRYRGETRRHPHPVRPGEAEVVPFSKRLQRRALTREEARRTARYGIAQGAVEKRLYKMIGKMYPGLSAVQRLALKESVILGLPANPEVAATELGRRIARIVKARADDGLPAEFKRGDELPLLRQAVEQADEVFTPQLRQAADELRRAAKRGGQADPSLSRDAMVARAYAPLVEHLKDDLAPPAPPPGPTPPFRGYGGRAGPGVPPPPLRRPGDAEPGPPADLEPQIRVVGDEARTEAERAGYRVAEREKYDPREHMDEADSEGRVVVRDDDDEWLNSVRTPDEEGDALMGRGAFADQRENQDVFIMEPNPYFGRRRTEPYAHGTSRDPIGVTWEPGRWQRGILWGNGSLHTWDPGRLIHMNMRDRIMARRGKVQELADPSYQGPHADLDIGADGTIYARLIADDPTPENVAAVRAQIEKQFGAKGWDVRVADVRGGFDWNPPREPIHLLDEPDPEAAIRDTVYDEGISPKSGFGHAGTILGNKRRMQREGNDALKRAGFNSEQIAQIKRTAQDDVMRRDAARAAAEPDFDPYEGGWEERQVQGRVQEWEGNENLWDEMEAEAVKWGPADEATFGRVPELRKTAPEVDTDNITFEQIEALRKQRGLEAPGYFPSDLQPGIRPPRGKGSILGLGKGKAYHGKLRRLGLEDAGEATITAGLRANIARRFAWNRAADTLHANALPYAAGETPSAIWAAVTQADVNPNDIVVLHVQRLRAADANPYSEWDDILAQVVQKADSEPSEFANRPGWVAVPREVVEEIQREFQDPAGLTKIHTVLKSKASRVILGSLNVPWLQFQIASNLALTGLAKTGPVDIVKAQLWWRSLSKGERAAVEPDLGQGQFAYDVTTPQLLSDEAPLLVQKYRAWRKSTRAGRRAGAVNPITAMFRGDAAQNKFHRRAVLYSQVKRDAYRRMDATSGKMLDAQGRIAGFFGLGPKKQMAAVLRDGDAMRKHAEYVNDFLGDYMTFSATERKWLANNVMFYAFLRFSLRLVFYTMPIKHPTTSAIIGKLSLNDPQDVERLIGPGLLPYQLGRFYLQDGKMVVDLSRANPALSALTAGDTVTQRAAGLLPPHLQLLWTQIARQVPYTGKGLRLHGDPQELKPIETFGPKDRSRVALRQLLNLVYPARVTERIMAEGEPLGADHLFFSPRPVQFVDPKVLSDIRNTKARRGKIGTERGILNEVIPFLPRPSADEAIAESRFEQLQNIKKRRRNRGKSQRRAKSPLDFGAGTGGQTDFSPGGGGQTDFGAAP